jgi:hypothetical protein
MEERRGTHTAAPLILGAKILQKKYISFLFKKKKVVSATAKKRTTAGERKMKRRRKESTKKVLSLFVINMQLMFLSCSHKQS